MKKLLNTLYITDEKAYLSLDGENIVCLLDDNEKFRIPFANVESIFCFSYIGCSPAFMGKCVKNEVSLCFLSPQGRFLAKVCGETKENVILRKQQLERFNECQLTLIQNTVAAKLTNTRSLISRSQRNVNALIDDTRLENCKQKLADCVNLVYNTNDINVISGIEGNCAKAYFNIFDRLITQQKEDFVMNSRTKRPPMDNINAMLSFLYTICTCDYASALESVGLDSYIGYYHTLRPGRSSLACDLVEESRCIVERAVLSMINLKIINNSDFEKQVSGAVFLNENGRKKVLTYWQNKKRENFNHPYLKQKIQYGLLPFIQSSLLAKFVRQEIDEYPNFLQG